MKKEDILKRANKDIESAQKQGIKPTGFTNRDPYPVAPAPKKRPKNVSKKVK